MKVAIIGANGQLGSDLVKAFTKEEVIPLTHKDIEVCNYEETRNILRNLSPDVVINTAAYHKVDACEENVEKSFEVNAYAVRNLAFVCKDINVVLMHMGTDYIFGGEKTTPYVEDDLPNPINVYGVSKLAGEYFLKNIWEKHFIIRTSGLYGVAGSSGKGGNFIELMLNLAKSGKQIRVVTDQVLSPTYTKELAQKMGQIVDTEEYGLYHVTGNNHCSWYEFAQAIFEISGVKADLSPTTTEEFGAKAKRPRYSVLDNFRLRQLGMDDMKNWREALRKYMLEKGHIL